MEKLAQLTWVGMKSISILLKKMAEDAAGCFGIP